MSEMVEVADYLFGFWRFMFSSQYRGERLTRYHRMSRLRQMMELFGASISAVIGVGFPVIVVVMIVN